MTTYKEEKDRLDAIAEASEVATEAAAQIASFFKRHPEVRDLQANYSIIYGYFHGDIEDISESTLEDSWANHPAFRKSLACYPNEADERESLESRILAFLKDGCSPQALKEIQKAFRFQNLPQLRAKKDDLESRAAMRSKSPAELRADIQSARPNPEQELPEDISRDQIIRMWGPEQIRFWAKKVGMDAINRRINQKD